MKEQINEIHTIEGTDINMTSRFNRILGSVSNDTVSKVISELVDMYTEYYVNLPEFKERYSNTEYSLLSEELNKDLRANSTSIECLDVLEKIGKSSAAYRLKVNEYDAIISSGFSIESTGTKGEFDDFFVPVN